MRINRSILLSDSAFALFLIACVVCVVFTMGDPNSYILNIILLNIAFLIAILTYYTTVTTGLILNIIFIFGYGYYVTYQTIILGELISGGSYFWLIMTPLLTAISWMLTSSNKAMQKENETLQEKNNLLATMDIVSNLKNNQSFQSDAAVLMAVSTRFNIPLTLLVMHVKYWDELKNMNNKKQLENIIQDVSQIAEAGIRTGDSVYMLSTDYPTWGLLLFTELDGAKIVIDRLKGKLNEFNSKDSTYKKKVKLQLVVGVVEYDPDTIHTPLEFILEGRKKMEFDV